MLRASSLRRPIPTNIDVRAFEPTRWYEPAMTAVTRASLPFVLGAIVVVYLSWAFSTASALMQ